jgi:shikimate kinase
MHARSVSERPPDLLFIIGPPAVGKMAVGAEIAKRTGFKLLHNHMTIEPVIRIFEWGTPQAFRLIGEFRRRILEEVVHSDLPGLVFTVVWAFGHPGEAESIEGYAAPFRAAGARIFCLELDASQEARLARNETELRLREKPSMNDIETTRARLLDADTKYRFTSNGELDDWEHHLRVDNTDLTVEAVAELAIDAFGLQRIDT